MSQLVPLLRKSVAQQSRQHLSNVLHLLLPIGLTASLAFAKRAIVRELRGAEPEAASWYVALLIGAVDKLASLLGTTRIGAVHLAHAGLTLLMVVCTVLLFVPLVAHGRDASAAVASQVRAVAAPRARELSVAYFGFWKYTFCLAIFAAL